MFITYNDINLSITSIDQMNRETVFSDDGTTVLYTEYTISVSAVYSPPIGGIPQFGGTSVSGTLRNPSKRVSTNPPPRRPGNVRGSDPFTPDAPPPRVRRVAGPPRPLGSGGILEPIQVFPNILQANRVRPIKSSGSNPAQPTSCTIPNPGSDSWQSAIGTDRELEVRLRVPRKKLIIWAFDSLTFVPVAWIESPRQQNPADAKGGPVVLNCTVKPGPNANSFFVALDIRTWITPCEDKSDRPILSHRWTMAHTEDDNHYLTRTVKGEAVFNLGVIYAMDQSPDWFRSQLFHPIPLGFQRKLGPIVLSPDGTTLAYEYSDTDTTCVFDAADTGATHMEIVEKVSYHNPWRGMS